MPYYIGDLKKDPDLEAISPQIWLIIIVALTITPYITTHEPPSMDQERDWREQRGLKEP